MKLRVFSLRLLFRLIGVQGFLLERRLYFLLELGRLEHISQSRNVERAAAISQKPSRHTKICERPSRFAVLEASPQAVPEDEGAVAFEIGP